MKNFLKKVVNLKRKEIEASKSKMPINFFVDSKKLLKGVRDFREEISTGGAVNLIAEIKRKSPSVRKDFVKDFNVKVLAEIYEKNGAMALSVLTDKKYFGGDISHIAIAKKASSLPVLRKDFILDEYQVYESRYFGADAILLIARILTKEQIKSFSRLARTIGMSSLVEIHDEGDMDKALRADAEIIGINNRNLDDFTVDINRTFDLMGRLPGEVIKVSESGINARQDIERLRERGVDAALVGSGLLKSGNIAAKIRELIGNDKRG